MTVTAQELDNKYSFDRTKTAERSGVSYPSVKDFFKGKPQSVKTVSKILNVLPITPKERQELINSYFEPKE